jgi:diacylglycerol kinase
MRDKIKKGMKFNMKETKWSNKNFFQALKYALNGIKYVYSTQRNIIFQTIIGILVIICGLLFKISKIEWLILCITITLVLFGEFINTAIETTVDLCTEEKNEKAKIAKDVAAGAVLLTSLNAAIVGIIIFVPYIVERII